MSFEIQEITKAPLEGLKAIAGKKTALVIGAVALAGVVTFYLKNKNSTGTSYGANNSASTTSDAGAIVADQYINSLSTAKQNFETQLSGQSQAFEDAYNKLKNDTNASIQGMSSYYSNVVSQDEEKINNLQTQLQSSQDTFKTQLATLQDSLLQAISARANVPVSNPVVNSTPTPTQVTTPNNYNSSGSSGSSYSPNYNLQQAINDIANGSVYSVGNDGSVVTPSTPQNATPSNNPYNANTQTVDYTYNGVDYSGYNGSQDQWGSSAEDAYWNAFISG